MSTRVGYPLLVAAVAATVFFTALGAPRLWDEDEPKNAECAREMLERGDWLVPTFNYQLRTDKPILLYWLMLLAYHAAGVSEWSARCVSAALGVGTCLLTYGLGARLYRPAVGAWAGAALATSLLFGVAARAATPDSTLIFSTTLALYLYVRHGGVTSGTPSRLGLASVYAAMGLAVLAKGPVGVVLPTAVLVLFELCRPSAETRPAAAPPGGTWRDALVSAVRSVARTLAPGRVLAAIWRLRPLVAVAVVGAVALPWYVAVGLATDGAWLAGFLGKHNVGRFTTAMEGHDGPIFYYLIAILIGMFPWSVWLTHALVRLTARVRGGDPRRTSDVFLASWAGMYVGFFSLAGTKLPSYVLPAYPALAIVVAVILEEWRREPAAAPRGLWHSALAITALVGLGLAVGLPVALHELLAAEEWLGAVGLVLIVGAGAALVWARRGDMRRAVGAFATMALLFALGALALAAGRVGQHHTSPRLVAEARESAAAAGMSGAPPLATYRHFEPTLVYYARHAVPTLDTPEQLAAWLAAHPEGRLITRDEHLGAVRQVAGSGWDVIARRRRFLRDGELLIVGPVAATAARPAAARE